MNKFKLPPRFPVQTETVWQEYGEIARKYEPLDLGQGFPDYTPPKIVTENFLEVAKKEDALLHQYARGHGHPRLVNALSKLYSQLLGREIDPINEIVITTGAWEGIFCSIFGFVDVNDEVVIIEPYFDCYEPLVNLSGGTPKFIPLHLKGNTNSSSDWSLDPEELEGIFNEKTKLIILNTPHNPTGKVFSKLELQMIADLCIKWNVVCISDEVYEWAVYDGGKHVRIASLPGMWERTITICSAGKTYGITGWKIGWTYGPTNLLENIRMVHQNTVYTNPTPTQEAIAGIIEHETANLNSSNSYFKLLAEDLQKKRDFLVRSLQDAGLRPVVPQGGFFMLADWTTLKNVDLSQYSDKYKDFRFTKWLVKNIGLLGIPSTAFYHEENKHLSENYVRFCLVKKEETLMKVQEALNKLK